MQRLCLYVLASAVLVAHCTRGEASTYLIADPSVQYAAAVNEFGQVVRMNSIHFGSAGPGADGWGLSYDSLSGYVGYGNQVVNIDSNFANFGLHGGVVLTSLVTGGPVPYYVAAMQHEFQYLSGKDRNVLRITSWYQGFDFGIQVAYTTRLVNWPGIEFVQYSTIPKGDIREGTAHGNQFIDPLLFWGNILTGSGGGSILFPFGGLPGAGALVWVPDTDNPNQGNAAQVIYFEALGLPGQSPADLALQLHGLGADFVVVGRSNSEAGNGYVVGFGVVTYRNAAIPEPASLALFGMAVIGGALYTWRRRKQPEAG